jgi:hypothetical protein
LRSSTERTRSDGEIETGDEVEVIIRPEHVVVLPQPAPTA